MGLLPFPLSVFDASGGNISIADVVAFCGLLLLVFRGRTWRMGAPGLVILAYFAVAMISSTFSTDISEIVQGLGRMALVTLVPFMLFENLRLDIQKMRSCLAAYCVMSALLGLCSIYFFLTEGFDGSMYTLGINKNALGPIFGTAVVVVFAGLTNGMIAADRRRSANMVLALSAIGLLLSLSRGGWVGTCAGILVTMLGSRKIKAFLIASVLFALLIAIVWSILPEKAIDYATDISAKTYTIRTRLESIHAVLGEFDKHPLLGAGIGLRRVLEPHNVLILVLGETGIIGFIAFIAMVGTAIFFFISTMRRVPRFSPAWQIVLTGLSAFTVFHVQTLVDVYWRRGVGAFGWACLGMTLSIMRTTLSGPIQTRHRHPRIFETANRREQALAFNGKRPAALPTNGEVYA